MEREQRLTGDDGLHGRDEDVARRRRLLDIVVAHQAPEPSMRGRSRQRATLSQLGVLAIDFFWIVRQRGVEVSTLR